jgi:general secretion pathway protein G
MIQHLTRKRDQEGFTLIELLVVIVILGILAAVVVFAVGGITDKGQTSACKTDTKTLRTAEEAYFAKNDVYSDEANLKSKGFLAEESDLHDITFTAAVAASAGPPVVAAVPSSYKVKVGTSDEAKKCGTAGADVNGTSNL